MLFESRSFACVWGKFARREGSIGAASSLLHSGRRVLRFFGPLVLWSFGPLVLWSFGPSVLPSFRPSVLRFFGPSVLPSFRPSVIPSRRCRRCLIIASCSYHRTSSVAFISIAEAHIQANLTSLTFTVKPLPPQKRLSTALRHSF